MPNQLFEIFVRHFNVIGASAVDEANNCVVDLKYQKPLRINGDALCNLFKRRSFIPLIGSRFDIKTTRGI